MIGELYSTLSPLPPNSTAVCQPLDVSAMGSLKKRLEVAWLEEESEPEMTAIGKCPYDTSHGLSVGGHQRKHGVVRFRKSSPMRLRLISTLHF